MKRARVLVADDHKIVLEGLRTLLEPHFELVGEANDGLQVLDAARELRPDVIVLDISMPKLNGIEAARKLTESGSTAKIVFLTMHPDVAYAARAFEVGASGYVVKHSASSELVLAIHEALAGRTFVAPVLAKELVRHNADPAERRRRPDRVLTSRQREVLQLLAAGRSAKQIASALNISSRTAEFHKYRMMESLGVRTSAELVQYAIKHGIV